MPISEKEFKELKRAAMKACKKVEKSIKEEPSNIVIYGCEAEESKEVVHEITSWLFHRR